jgi:hypothetical protein
MLERMLSDQDTRGWAWQFLSFESRLIRRTDHNQYLLSTSLVHTHLHQSYTRHRVLTGHLPYISNAGTMYEALSQALLGKAFDQAFRRRAIL